MGAAEATAVDPLTVIVLRAGIVLPRTQVHRTPPIRHGSVAVIHRVIVTPILARLVMVRVHILLAGEVGVRGAVGHMASGIGDLAAFAGDAVEGRPAALFVRTPMHFPDVVAPGTVLGIVFQTPQRRGAGAIPDRGTAVGRIVGPGQEHGRLGVDGHRARHGNPIGLTPSGAVEDRDDMTALRSQRSLPVVNTHFVSQFVGHVLAHEG